MSDVVQLDGSQYRAVVALRYLNACEFICKGMQTQQGANDFYFLITLRSFIEYSRRGMWFLVWASDEILRQAEMPTFRRPNSPNLVEMDEMINDALGQGKLSGLRDKLQGIDEPFIDCLHALTHGNPISVRMTTYGLDKIFSTEKLLARVELDLDIFRVVVYRRILGEDIGAIWKILGPSHDRPADVRANARIAAHMLKQSGKLASSIGYELP
ncbi:MAG: hypothetical protein ABSH52_00700 [Terriglobia bacterium]|jgi:hypothetical protein